MFLLTMVTLAIAAYAHLQISRQAVKNAERWFLHCLLAIIGIAFAWVTSKMYHVTWLLEILILLSAFGVVHVPAAAILFIKQQRKKR